MKVLSRAAPIVCVVLLSAMCALINVAFPKEGGPEVTVEKNTALSELIFRLRPVATAGADPNTGEFLVKVYRVPLGGECDTDSDLCKGEDLLISVASLDLDGDNALYRIKGIARWEFVSWSKYAKNDAPDSSTTFVVALSVNSGRALTQCSGSPSGTKQSVTFEVNPWKLSCEYRK